MKKYLCEEIQNVSGIPSRELLLSLIWTMLLESNQKENCQRESTLWLLHETPTTSLFNELCYTKCPSISSIAQWYPCWVAKLWQPKLFIWWCYAMVQQSWKVSMPFVPVLLKFWIVNYVLFCCKMLDCKLRIVLLWNLFDRSTIFSGTELCLLNLEIVFVSLVKSYVLLFTILSWLKKKKVSCIHQWASYNTKSTPMNYILISLFWLDFVGNKSVIQEKWSSMNYV